MDVYLEKDDVHQKILLALITTPADFGFLSHYNKVQLLLNDDTLVDFKKIKLLQLHGSSYMLYNDILSLIYFLQHLYDYEDLPKLDAISVSEKSIIFDLKNESLFALAIIASIIAGGNPAFCFYENKKIPIAGIKIKENMYLCKNQ